MKSLAKICKNNCLNEYYMNIFDVQREQKELSSLNMIVLAIGPMPKHEI
jgi:hypothetical protein